MDQNLAFVLSRSALDSGQILSLRNEDPRPALAGTRPSSIALSNTKQPSRDTTVSGLTGWQQNKVVRYIDDNIDTSLRVKDIAQQVRLSVSRFSKGFKVSFGQSPYDYVLSQRIETAKYIIANTDEPLSQVAHSCGLSDQPHLSKVFKRLVGMTPLKWRRHAALLKAGAPRNIVLTRPIMGSPLNA